MTVPMVNILCRQASQIRHPELGLFSLELGRARIPKLATECSEFQYLVEHKLVELGSKAGDQEDELAQARLKAARDKLTHLQQSSAVGPDLVFARPNKTLDGTATGNFDLVAKKTGEAIGQSFSNEREAHAAAERMNEQAWGAWVAAKTPARKRQ